MTSLRIHPAIGMARVGASQEYYLGPETMAGMPQEGTTITGGLPIKKGTDNTTINSEDLRDCDGRLKRQAARFKIYQYEDESPLAYPSGGGKEVTIGSVVDGDTVVDIVWTVHLANKKPNCWIDEGLEAYKGNARPPMRNIQFPPSQDPADENRLRKLVTDAGPRAICAKDQPCVAFDKTTQASYWDKETNQITSQPNYPISFPASCGDAGSYTDASRAITSLGEMTSEANGRLVVLGAFGKACGFDKQGNPDPNAPLNDDVNNDYWHDDTSDGPVTAVLIFESACPRPIPGSAWVVATDPGYAPQVLNSVSQWDDIYTTWLENFELEPAIYAGIQPKGTYQKGFKPYFPSDVFPLLRSASLQMWATNLPSGAINAHNRMDQLTEEKPAFDFLSFIRNPDGSQNENGSPLMPLSLGDFQQSFLTVSPSQYFFLEQWVTNMCEGAKPRPLGPGEQLDMFILANCLGGRYSPGIDMTFIVRDPNLYNADWHNPDIGPFRINAEPLNYATATKDKPFLGVGYIPLQEHPVQPGDICKFMAIPWHTDYNSCATHTPAPNPGGSISKDKSNVYSGVNTTLFWSWPAQRPVAVYTYDDLVANSGKLPTQRYSVRGEGTETSDASEVGRYQDRINILINWDKIGMVIQGPAIKGYPADYPANYYLEVKSEFAKDDSNLVEPWPTTVTSKTYPPKDD